MHQSCPATRSSSEYLVFGVCACLRLSYLTHQRGGTKRVCLHRTGDAFRFYLQSALQMRIRSTLVYQK